MDDDIDIEEHDVLDNPIIKSIFPDLSILKKEVFDESYEGYNPEENLDVDTQSNSSTAEEINNVISSPAPFVHAELVSNYNNSSINDQKVVIDSYCEDLTNISVTNRIILGSKPNNTESNEGKPERNIYSATVKLKNISPYLDCCKKYCQICSILFPSKEALNVHIKHFHFVQIPDKIKLHEVCELNQENNTEHLNLNKPKCNICDKYFASKNSLNKHRRNIHFIMIRSARRNKTMKPKNILKTRNTDYDDNRTNNDVNSCFHCENKFPNMQCLIEHLYDTLQTKKESKDLDNARENINKLKFYNKGVIDNAISLQKSDGKVILQRKGIIASLKKYFYRCPICFYYYNNEKCSSDHLLNQHKFLRKAPLKKVLFDPKCKLCLSEFKTVKRYNAHIYKVHRKMFTRKSGHSKKPAAKKCKDKNIHESNLTNEMETVLTDVNNLGSSPPVSTNIGIFKSALFRCLRCDIHFLNCHTATDHTNHMDVLINWKCSLCTRIFKNIDEHTHRQQHLVSDNFTVYGINESSVVLFKCLKCDIHFDENTYVQHYPVCGKIATNHMKCNPCGILLDYNIYEVHNDYHNKKFCETSDMVIVQTEILQDNNENEHILKRDSKELRTEIAKTDDIIDNKAKDIKKNHLFTVYFCRYCKCFINDKLLFHKKTLCFEEVSATCKLCGLVITRKSLNSHGRLHLKKKDLTLQDFKFLDLNSKKPISPPIPVFPHCGVCGIYFANLITKMRHECGFVNFVTCYDCSKDYSKLAYRLHMSYHNYQLGNNKIKLTKHSSPTLSKDNKTDVSELEKEALISNVEIMERFIIFTCKNCDISLDTYDLVVEHCQEHHNPVTKPLPSKICKTCNLKFSAECFERHKKLHEHNSDSVSVIFVKFDLFYFTTDYKAWMKRMFIFLPHDLKESIINKSIYKYENRIKMRIIQEGSTTSMGYKCDKCQCFIDPSSLYKHLGKHCTKVRKHLCKICEMPFISDSSKSRHEAEVHSKLFKGLKSCRIVLFNKEEDGALNEALQNSQVWFTLYKCRSCGGIISKESETDHLCYRRFLKECSHCSLLFYRKELRLHLAKHKEVKTFKGENMKVIVIGKKNENYNVKHDSVVSMFKGKVCDYLLYKCKSCQVCLCDANNIQKHDCANSNSKMKCSQCGFNLEAKNMDDHCMQHETDCDFVAENITVIEFDGSSTTNLDFCVESTSSTASEDREVNIINVKENSTNSNDTVDVVVKTAKLYKCPCGLHFMDKSVMAHLNFCYGNRISRQQCSKCGLAFSTNVLFKHLLSHHGDKNVSYTFEVIEVFKKEMKTL